MVSLIRLAFRSTTGVDVTPVATVTDFVFSTQSVSNSTRFWAASSNGIGPGIGVPSSSHGTQLSISLSTLYSWTLSMRFHVATTHTAYVVATFWVHGDFAE